MRLDILTKTHVFACVWIQPGNSTQSMKAHRGIMFYLLHDKSKGMREQYQYELSRNEFFLVSKVMSLVCEIRVFVIIYESGRHFIMF